MPSITCVAGQHVGAVLHQVGDGAAVARALHHEIADQRHRLRMVQLHAAGQPAAGHLRGHGDQQLVLLARGQVHRSAAPDTRQRAAVPQAGQSCHDCGPGTGPICAPRCGPPAARPRGRARRQRGQRGAQRLQRPGGVRCGVHQGGDRPPAGATAARSSTACTAPSSRIASCHSSARRGAGGSCRAAGRGAPSRPSARGRTPASRRRGTRRPRPARRRGGGPRAQPSNRIVSCGSHSRAAPGPARKHGADLGGRPRAGCGSSARPPGWRRSARVPGARRDGGGQPVALGDAAGAVERDEAGPRAAFRPGQARLQAALLAEPVQHGGVRRAA